MGRWLVAVLSLLTMAQTSTDAERAVVTNILSHIDAHNTEALALLERVVNINSGTHNLAGVKAVGAIFTREFDRLGFTPSWIDGAAGGRAGHLVAEHPGRGPKVLLIGHLDTV